MPLYRGVVGWLVKLSFLRLTVTQELSPSETTKKCAVFTHMNKCGGTSIKTMLQSVPGMSLGVFSERTYAKGPEELRFFLDQHFDLMAGGPTEVLRSFDRSVEDCNWFTMFRHPVSRLVSNFYYECKGTGLHNFRCNDKLKDGEDDLREYAKLWGAWAPVRFSLSFVDQATLLALQVDPELCPSWCPTWVRGRVYFERLLGADETLANDMSYNLLTNSSVVATFLEPAVEILATKYAAVGILEDWGRSMQLFDHAVPLPNFSWSAASANIGRQNVDNKYADVEHETLQRAMADPVITRYLWLDILFYDHAVRIHNKQLKEFGLS
eukprot:g6155.t1